MSNAPPQAHPNWMLTATPKGWHYNRTQSGCALALYKAPIYRDSESWSGAFGYNEYILARAADPLLE